MNETIIFDLDGTLIDLPINYDKLFQEFSKIMKKTEIRPITKTISKLDERRKRRVFEVWETIELDAFENMTIVDEGMKLYKRFSKNPKALVTMQGKTLVQNAVEHTGLSFDFTVTREDSLDRTKQLGIAAKKLKTPLKKILFIGNTDEDSDAAKKTGCRFLRVGE